MRTKTVLYKSIIDKELAKFFYSELKENIQWVDGVRSKKGFTRKAKPLNFGDNGIVDNIIVMVMSRIGVDNLSILGLYLNYYRDGNDWTPNHTHKKTKQLVISLGETRILTMNKKEYKIESGDVIVFGSSVHGVPKDNSTNGRISIATFHL